MVVVIKVEKIAGLQRYVPFGDWRDHQCGSIQASCLVNGMDGEDRKTAGLYRIGIPY